MSASTPRRNEVVFITGCSNGGIGAAIAAQCASQGCTVYASSRSIQSMSNLVDDRIHKLVVDVTDDDSCRIAVETIYAEAGRIDVFLSNAGLTCVGPLLDVSLETTMKVMDTNILGTVRLVHLIAPRMAELQSGLIVTMGSILGELGTPFSGVYNASKAALHAYTETLAMECRPLGIKVMLVVPGSIVSNIANNQAKTYTAPEKTLYAAYAAQIARRMFASQGKDAMDTNEFARFVVARVLSPNPPLYITAGGTVRLWWFFKWLPRTMALNIIWKSLTKP